MFPSRVAMPFTQNITWNSSEVDSYRDLYHNWRAQNQSGLTSINRSLFDIMKSHQKVSSEIGTLKYS